jgi:hypothetical protein
VALEIRDLQPYFFGKLTLAAAVSDLTLTSTAFAVLGTAYSNATPGIYLPLVLQNPALGSFSDEVVYVIGHTASSNTVTVLRGREGTTARSWPEQTEVSCAPTPRDALTSFTRSSLPTDAHVGMRNAVQGESVVVQWTRTQGWQPDVGIANPGDVGPNGSGTNPPITANILARAGDYTGTTSAGGSFTVPYRVQFPTATLAATTQVVSSVGGTVILALEARTATGFTVGVYNPATGAKYGAGIQVTLCYNASGW